MTLVILVYLGGVLSILSPCILPVIPFAIVPPYADDRALAADLANAKALLVPEVP